MRPAPATIVTALLASLLTVPASPAAASPPTSPPSTARPASSVTVPLITGDRITITVDESGNASFSPIAAARSDGRVPRFESYSVDESMFVVPDDAEPYLRSGQLDRTLFDVTYLMREGFGGADAIPVIAELDGAASLSSAVPGATAVRELESIHATALTVPAGGTFWTSLNSAGPAALSGRVSKVWLDRPVRASLDKSVARIGAPAAWSAGLDGSGTKIAVLDTGIDLNHPDFTDRVADTRDFTGKGSVQDGHFHGTHVASIAAGRGTASNGRFTGVAPGARLVVGKVLSDQGSGEWSQVIDGMEWAAGTGARVVNMSLGGSVDGVEDGTDPVAAALDRLSQSTGALFVVAAGNDGPAESTVGTPGIARTALTVSAVDTAGAEASFSSRGPLPYKRVLKPDLAAPGVSIAAARAEGTNGPTPIDDRYTRASGTSMATPHVAGAAAILAGQHPDWTGQQLKAALMSSSANLGLSAFLQGAGRVDVARAIAQRVVATGTLDFGRATVGEDTPITRTITYVNHAAAEVTLNLAAQVRKDGGGGVPRDTITAPSTVTVPASGSAEVSVRLAPSALGAGLYSGTLLATDAAAGGFVRTPVGFARRKATFPVQVEVIGREGEPCGTIPLGCYISASKINAYNLDNPDDSVMGFEVPFGGGTLPLVPGRYRIFAAVFWRSESMRIQDAFLVQPEVRVGGAATVRLDAREARPINIATTRPSEPYDGTMTLHRPYPPPAQRPPGAIYWPLAAWAAPYGHVSFWATPTAASSAGGFLLTTQQTRGAPLVELKIADGDGPDLHASYFNYPWFVGPDTDPRFTGRFTAPVVDVGSTVEPAELGRLRGALVLLSRTEMTQSCQAEPEEIAAVAEAGARGVLLFATKDICSQFPLAASSQPGGVPIVSLPFAEGEALRDLLTRRTVRLTVSGTPISPYLYNVKFYERDAIGANLSYRVDDSELARVPTRYHADQPTVTRRYIASFWGPDEPSTVVVDAVQVAPMRREELIGPLRDGQQWRRAVRYYNQDSDAEYTGTPLRRGGMAAKEWFVAPRVPGAALKQPTARPFCATCRQADTLYVAPNMAYPDPSTSTFLWTLPAEVRLYDGDKEIAGRLYRGKFPTFTLPSESTRLRLTHEWSNDRPERLYGNRVRTTWQFDSQRATTPNNSGSSCLATVLDGDQAPCSVQPLMFLRYDADVDESNRIRRAPSVLTVSGYHQDASDQRGRLKTMRVRVSFDDGVTWQPTWTLWGSGNDRTVLLPTPPRGAGAVSVHVEATDTTGATVTQEVLRAYGVR